MLTDHPSGMLWSFRFQDGKAQRVFDPAASDLPASWIWIHFPLSDHRARNFIQRSEDMPQAVRDTLLGPDRNPFIQILGGWVYGVLPDFERAFDGDTSEAGRLRFACGETRFITARAHPLLVTHAMEEAMAEGRLSFVEPFDAFLGLNNTYHDLVEEQLDELIDRLDSIEDKVLAIDTATEFEELGPLRRMLAHRHRELALLRTGYLRAMRQPHTAGHQLAQHLPLLQQQIEDLDREIVAAQDRGRLIHEEIDTKITAATNRTLRALTIMSVLLLPPTLMAGAFGMNVNGIPFSLGGSGFFWAFGTCILSAIGAYVLLTRMRVL